MANLLKISLGIAKYLPTPLFDPRPALMGIRYIHFTIQGRQSDTNQVGLKPEPFTMDSPVLRNFNCSLPELRHLFPGCSSHEELYNLSINQTDLFWGTLARLRLRWNRDFQQVSDCNMETGSFRWFLGGQLNVSVNCVDRHKEKDPSRVALIWEKDEPGQEERVTYGELYTMMNQVSNVLKSQGVQKGDRVAIYMPPCPLAVASMLACARIGAVHSVVFAGFSAEALASRINDAEAKIVITADQGMRGGKLIELKKTVVTAVEKCPTVKTILVAKRTGNPVVSSPLDVDLDEAMVKESGECEPAVLDSEDLLFMLYTSGSTGNPKGIVHSQAGYLLYASLTHSLVFDCKEGDIFGCVADIGWITGHSYVVYGPLANGVTTLLFESTPTYPNPGRYWETVQRLKINQLYAAPTAIRLLLKYGDEHVEKYDLSSLRTLGSVGEPINVEAWHWYNKVVGKEKCVVVDTWWQTETGGICISPTPSAPGSEILPGMPMRPMYGIWPAILGEKGEELKGNDVTGALCLKKPWPGMARTIYGTHSRFLETYYRPFNGFYFTGDGAVRHSDGYYQITGRMDDVINVTGHRLGTAEVENALGQHPSVAESAVVGYPCSDKGEGIYAYVTLKDGLVADAKTEAELRGIVRQKIAAYAIPDVIQICPSLPKTRSGKIMRRILRKVAADETDNLGDISTLADPAVVEDLVARHRTLKSNHLNKATSKL
ncbi:acetyl-coenzyme A synthetase 2-like, mitochondrial isoform X2 [Daphnia pulicaria]|uniref:acetyl-coenzyme A synthetase 2-like, mitochondrial isoform X2 n=1 Tax=Daphnia pulicaria TaxID=35523 RepID=UPI001EEA8B13|nr:acetyl-coenzyme A synthetase 2-like, mitochondrial isoform X2 [Daphnia pulicaria]